MLGEFGRLVALFGVWLRIGNVGHPLPPGVFFGTECVSDRKQWGGAGMLYRKYQNVRHERGRAWMGAPPSFV